jgi:regulator of protease activity HflC (stomatin/prohibitin superfamily)
MPGIVATVIVLAVLLFLVVPVLFSTIRVIKEYQRLVVFRLGRIIGQKGPGLVIVLPFIDRVQMVDLRELFLEIPKQTCITKDNAPIDIDFLIFWRVVDPVTSVVQVGNFAGASQGIATTTLRAVIGDIPLDDVLAKREDINKVLRVKLDEVTERWGVKVTTVEIREITPPREVQGAMNRQLAAERERRATVTEADGKREASIMVAEGERQATILRAEADRQGLILRAEGDRQAAILRAEGYSVALDKIYAVARGIDEKTLSLQYLNAISQLGNSPATKFVLPLELVDLVKPFRAYMERAGSDGGAATQP